MPRALTRSSTESAEMPWIFGNLDQLIVPRQAGLPGSADVLVALADVRMRQATAKIEGDQAGVLRSGRTPRLRRQRRGQRRDPLERPGPPPRSAGGLRAGYVGRTGNPGILVVLRTGRTGAGQAGPARPADSGAAAGAAIRITRSATTSASRSSASPGLLSESLG